jgi:hypothetical protein
VLCCGGVSQGHNIRTCPLTGVRCLPAMRRERERERSEERESRFAVMRNDGCCEKLQEG